jgi:steroid delta-isomerase-like uncharacterized protein
MAGTTTPGEVARKVVDGLTARDPDAIVQFTAPDAYLDFVAVGVLHGREDLRRFFVDTFASFPDFTFTVDRIVSDERSAVIQWRVAGTFTGKPFLGIAATGRRLALQGIELMEIEDGTVRRNTVYYDGASFARQIGMLPKKDGAGERAMRAMFNLRTRAARLVRRS